jgi:hypothetical protein
MECSFKTSAVYPNPEALFHFVQNCGGAHRLLHRADLFDEAQDFLRDFVPTARATLSGEQSCYPFALVVSRNLIKGWPGKPKRSNSIADGLILHVDLAKHLVLDLNQISGVEKIAFAKQGISYGMSIQCAGLSQEFLFGIVGSGLGHKDLLKSSALCKSYYAA